MIYELQRLIKHSGIYGAGIVLSKAIGFFLIPVYTRFLTPSDYGVLELLDLIIFFAGIFAAMGIYSAVFRFYAAAETEQEKKAVISTALLYNSGVSLLFCVALVLLAPFLAENVLGDVAFAPYVRVVAFTLLFSNLAEVPLAYWRAQGRTTLFVAVGLGRTLLGGALLVIAIAGLKLGVRGAVYAGLLANAIAGSVLFAIVLSRVPRRIVPEKLKQMLRYGVPLVAQSVASFVLVFSDRFFLRHFGDLNEVGIYALGYKLAGIVSILISGPFGLAWAYQQFEVAKLEDAGRAYAKIQEYLMFVTVFLGLGVAVLASDVVRVIAPSSYGPAARVVPLIAFSYILSSARSVVLSGIYVRQATRYLAPIAFVTALANLLLNYILIARLLAMGAAVATVLSYALALVLTYRVGQWVYPVRYGYARNALILGPAALIYLLSTVHHLSFPFSLLGNTVLVLLFPVIYFSLAGEEDRRTARELIAQVLRRFSSAPVPEVLPPGGGESVSRARQNQE